MPINSAPLSSSAKLEALREHDVFHRWASLDEKRLCRRCGQIICGHEIKTIVVPRRRKPSRLECPTEGCPSVPIEWLVIESAATPQEAATETQPHAALGFRRRIWRRPAMLGFLRVPAMPL
ncbi:MAG: hypothetical protein ACR2G0_09900 [Chthoniobacterales bacterium]